jgi:hypothetical protein
MGESQGNFKRVAEVKGYTSPADCEAICTYCRKLLDEYDQQDFLRFRDSDECHFN